MTGISSGTLLQVFNILLYLVLSLFLYRENIYTQVSTRTGQRNCLPCTFFFCRGHREIAKHFRIGSADTFILSDVCITHSKKYSRGKLKYSLEKLKQSLESLQKFTEFVKKLPSFSIYVLFYLLTSHSRKNESSY